MAVIRQTHLSVLPLTAIQPIVSPVICAKTPDSPLYTHTHTHTHLIKRDADGKRHTHTHTHTLLNVMRMVKDTYVRHIPRYGSGGPEAISNSRVAEHVSDLLHINFVPAGDLL